MNQEFLNLVFQSRVFVSHKHKDNEFDEKEASAHGGMQIKFIVKYRQYLKMHYMS